MLSKLLLDIVSDKYNHNELELLFDEVATEVLRKTKLVSGSNEYLIKEIEFYFSSDHYKHLDPYIHGNIKQQLYASWYFHRFNSIEKYANQKFKGVDITFGARRYNNYGGILIRKIKNIKTNETIDGIGKIVSAIMKDIGTSAFVKVAKAETMVIFDQDSLLHLELFENSLDKPIYKGVRKGLGKPKNELQSEFYDKRYNYFNDWDIKLVAP